MDLFLGDAKIDTEVTSEIMRLEINDPNNNKLVCFQSNTSLLSEDSIQEQTRKMQISKGHKSKPQMIQVYVSILEMEWISEHEKMVEFYRFISAQTEDKFANDLIITILEH
jgi:hypothetical protein